MDNPLEKIADVTSLREYIKEYFIMAILHRGREAKSFKTGLGVACIEKDDIKFAS